MNRSVDKHFNGTNSSRRPGGNAKCFLPYFEIGTAVTETGEIAIRSRFEGKLGKLGGCVTSSGVPRQVLLHSSMSFGVRLQGNKSILDFFCYILRHMVQSSHRPFWVDVAGKGRISVRKRPLSLVSRSKWSSRHLRGVQKGKEVTIIQYKDLGFNNFEVIRIDWVTIGIHGSFNCVCTDKAHVELSI